MRMFFSQDEKMLSINKVGRAPRADGMILEDDVIT